MIFVDSGAWFAAFVPADNRHVEAIGWLGRNTQALVTTDYVVDEVLTLLKARGENERAVMAADEFFQGNLASLHFLTADEIRGAWQVFRRFSDKRWSFTDCTSKVVMEAMGIPTAFAFDHHFRQFGGVQVVP